MVAFSSRNCWLLGQRVSQVCAGWLPGEGCVLHILSSLGRLGRSGLRWLNTLSVPHWVWLRGWWLGAPCLGRGNGRRSPAGPDPGQFCSLPQGVQPALAYPGRERERGRLRSASVSPVVTHLQPDSHGAWVGCQHGPPSCACTVPGRAVLLQQMSVSFWPPSSPSSPHCGFHPG